MSCIMGVVPWWSLPLNWLIGMFFIGNIFPSGKLTRSAVTFGNLAGSLFFAAILVKCTFSSVFSPR